MKSPSVGQGQRGEGKVDSEGELGEGTARRLQEEGRWGNRWRGKQADGEAGSRKTSAEGPRQGASAGAAAGAGLGDGGDAKELKQVECAEAAGGQGEDGEEGEEEEGVSGSDAEGEEGSSGSGDSEGSDGSSSSEEGEESDAASPSGRGAAGNGHEGGFDLTPDQRWQRREAEAKQARIQDLLQVGVGVRWVWGQVSIGCVRRGARHWRGSLSAVAAWERGGGWIGRDGYKGCLGRGAGCVITGN